MLLRFGVMEKVAIRITRVTVSQELTLVPLKSVTNGFQSTLGRVANEPPISSENYAGPWTLLVAPDDQGALSRRKPRVSHVDSLLKSLSSNKK